MPGLNQLKKFAQDIDALGNEAERRVEKNETLPKVELPTNIYETDDSEEFIFGLPEQESLLDANDNTDIDSSLSTVNNSEEIDIEAILASAASENNETTAESDISIPGIDDNLDLSVLDNLEELDASFLESTDTLGTNTSDLDSFENVEELVDDVEEIETIDNPLSNDNQSSDDVSEEFDFTPEDMEMDFTPENLREDIDIKSSSEEYSDFSSTIIDESELSESSEDSLDHLYSNVDTSVDSPVAESGDDFSVPDFDFGATDSPVAESGDDFSVPDFDFGATDSPVGETGDDFSVPDFDFGATESPVAESGDDFSVPDFGFGATDSPVAESGDDFSVPDFDFGATDSPDAESGDDFSVPDFGFGATDSPVAESGDDFSAPDFEFGATDSPVAETGDDFSALDFDASNFTDIPDSGLGENVDGFENLDNSSSEFDSSFSDFDLVPPEVPQETKKRNISFSSGKSKKEEILSTELTEDEYKTFLKNLNYYPLNLRLAIEEMIIGNEFNDDVVMEIIHKVIKKVPARQLAGQVEKLMDRAIPVPSNYEKRTVAEYEAYRHSFEYNLKNKILPFSIAGIFALAFCILIGFLTAKFVVRPVKANMLYKEGYTLIENGLYPQSESKFNEAVSYNSVKKWHFKYARAYVENNQYERASSMYERLLMNFKYDLKAGLEYASMELEERSNYSKAEEIVRRFILDHHINSPEGILLLGDVFLEWATNRDPTKFEDARLQYATLIQLYGQNPLYLSRMMRYFIRTDNLEEVLQLKEYFYPKIKKDILEPKDIVELSGYMLEKLYGELPAKDEYLRSSIEDVRDLLEIAVVKAPDIPEAMYNYGRYFVETGSNVNAQVVLKEALNKFSATSKKTQNRIIAEIDTYRLLGELSFAELDYLQAENYYVDGLTLFETEHENSNLRSDKKIGLLYADLADLDYFISGNFDAALSNYMSAIENSNDTPSIRYRIGYIQYSNDNYAEALGSFIKAVNEKPSDTHLLLALGNTLTIRNSTSAAQGYYEKLIDLLDLQRNQSGVLYPQTNNVDGELVELYMKAANNLGVVLALRAEQTGNSNLIPKAMANFEESIRAFDALTRNTTTMIRIDGSNLASYNQKYLTYTHKDFEPTIYTELSPIMEGERIPEKSVVE